ncbi:MAG: hypothetical protein ACRDPK_21060 [Carbonactinosporaceae bacterium]
MIVNASEADEAAAHHNWPAAYEHTMVVNSIRDPSLPSTKPRSHLYLNGCTNFGGYTSVSIPSTSCSSETTGRSAGYSGLLQSAARNGVERGAMTSYLRYRKGRYTQARFPLSAEEAYQLWRLSADDIDFASGCPAPAPQGRPPVPGHEFCDEAPPYPEPGDALPPAAAPDNYETTLPGSTRHQTVRGWDYFTGYGRANVARLLHYIGGPGPDGREGGGDDREYAVPDGDRDGFAPYGSGPSRLTAQQRIPPEADITAPRWWAQYPVTADRALLRPDDPQTPGMVVVDGRVAANRVTSAGGSYDYVLEWAPHVQGLRTGRYAAAGGYRPAASSAERSHGPWHEAARATGLTEPYQGELGRIPVPAMLDALAAAPNPFDRVTDPTSEEQPERHAIRLRVRVVAHPAVNSDGDPANDDRVNNEAVRQKQIDVYRSDEQAIVDGLGVGGRTAGGAGSPSFHDVNGDGVDELLLPTSDGLVHAYTAVRSVSHSAELPGWPVRTDRYAGVADHLGGDNAYTRDAVPTDVHAAILGGTVAVADLDDDGRSEVLAAALDGKLYAWGPDGTRRAGFPVSVDPRLSREVRCGPDTIPYCDDFAASVDAGPDTPSNPSPDPERRDEFNVRDQGINFAPAVGDLDPDDPGLEIVAGAGDGHVYAWHADGSPVRGWPVMLRDPAKVASVNRPPA